MKIHSLINNICTDTNRRRLVNVTASTTSSAHTADWTVVMTINDGYYDFFKNWLWFYQRLNLRYDMILFAEDRSTYQKLQQDPNLINESSTTTIVLNPNLKRQQQADDEATPAYDFWSKKYMQLVSQRPTRLLDVLCTGRNIVYVDADTVWLKDPFQFLQDPNKEKENQQQQPPPQYYYNTPLEFRDQASFETLRYLKNPDVIMAVDGINDLCTGFMSILANRRSLHLISLWEDHLLKQRQHDDIDDSNNNKITPNQHPFNMIYKSMYLRNDKDLVEIKGLSQNYFPTGQQYFLSTPSSSSSNNHDGVVQVHANCIIGHSKKKHHLIRHNLWKIESS